MTNRRLLQPTEEDEETRCCSPAMPTSLFTRSTCTCCRKPILSILELPKSDSTKESGTETSSYNHVKLRKMKFTTSFTTLNKTHRNSLNTSYVYNTISSAESSDYSDTNTKATLRLSNVRSEQSSIRTPSFYVDISIATPNSAAKNKAPPQLARKINKMIIEDKRGGREAPRVLNQFDRKLYKSVRYLRGVLDNVIHQGEERTEKLSEECQKSRSDELKKKSPFSISPSGLTRQNAVRSDSRLDQVRKRVKRKKKSPINFSLRRLKRKNAIRSGEYQ